jgi:excisionase family DNA binding protein
MMTTAELAALCRRSEDYIRRLARERRLPGRRLCPGGPWLFARADVERLLQPVAPATAPEPVAAGEGA